MMEKNTTHFGFETVSANEKPARVSAVFDSVAHRYDLMNDLLSLGIHRLWKKFAIALSGVGHGQRVLDLAAGTGDLAAQLAERVGPKGHVVLADINAAMLNAGRERLIERGIVGNVSYVRADAERLPFAESSFDCVTIAFGLRNVTHQETALRSISRVLRPGGRLVVLEFSHPRSRWLRMAYDLYSFSVLPTLGRLIARDAKSYRYLAESIRVHPSQETLKEMLQNAGLERCEFFNLSGGIVALHRGYRL
jgi:demethylmenaquinone methyltransferase/2-methoxy-6-polyprenyl-1,4-benzoquinol methylase